MKKSLLLLSTGACLTLASNAVVLSAWTFETNTPADLTDSALGPAVTAEAGLFTTGYTAQGTHASAVSDWSTPAGNGSANSYSVNTWAVGDYMQYATSSTGYTDITITFDHVSSGTGPRDFEIFYSTNGTVYTSTGISYDTFQSSNVGTNAFSFGSWNSTTAISNYSYSVDLSGLPALDNQATLFFRFLLTSTATPSGGVLSAGGTSRMDNVVINAVPEPTIAFLGSLGMFGLLRRRR
jgi:hypothetical protein